MKCPGCDVDLLMGELLGVSLDYCPKCRGIWISRDKFDKIGEQSSPPMQKRYGNDEDEHRRKKRSFFDMFD